MSFVLSKSIIHLRYVNNSQEFTEIEDCDSIMESKLRTTYLNCVCFIIRFFYFYFSEKSLNIILYKLVGYKNILSNLKP